MLAEQQNRLINDLSEGIVTLDRDLAIVRTNDAVSDILGLSAHQLEATIGKPLNELLSLVGNLDVLLGIRLHALIFAAIMQVPLIGISYDPKIERFLSMLGEKPIGSLRSLQAEELSEAVQALLQNPARPWLPRMRELRDKAYRAAELAVDLLNKKQG